MLLPLEVSIQESKPCFPQQDKYLLVVKTSCVGSKDQGVYHCGDKSSFHHSHAFAHMGELWKRVFLQIYHKGSKNDCQSASASQWKKI